MQPASLQQQLFFCPCDVYSFLLSDKKVLNTIFFYCQESNTTSNIKAAVNNEEEGVIDIDSCEEGEDGDTLSSEVTSRLTYNVCYLCIYFSEVTFSGTAIV